GGKLMPKKDTLALLDELEAFGLTEPLFQHIHHFGGSLKTFRAFCTTIGYFRKGGCNQLLHERLAHMLQECKNGTLKQGKSLGALAADAVRVVPLHRFPGCTKHRISI
ncbi:MAG: hypothetical protein WBC92_09295, partial [Terracidiphilus sp.]